MKRLLNQMLSLAAVAVLLPSATGLMAENIVFSGTDFESWNPPKGLVEVQVDGINIKRFGKSFNAVADAHLIADQDPRTWWKPATEDPTDKFWVELDLGRAVIARTRAAMRRGSQEVADKTAAELNEGT